jgi:hypothetical protein
MSLLSIPNELILEIGDYLTSPAGLNNLARTNRLFYRLLNERLYKRTPSLKALLRTIRHNRFSTMKRFVAGGLEIDRPIPAKLGLNVHLPFVVGGSVTLLRYAILWVTPGIARILLEAGANAKMCYMSRDAATTEIGKLLLRFGAKLEAPPPATVIEMSKSGFKFNFSGNILIMDYPDIMIAASLK